MRSNGVPLCVKALAGNSVIMVIWMPICAALSLHYNCNCDVVMGHTRHKGGHHSRGENLEIVFSVKSRSKNSICNRLYACAHYKSNPLAIKLLLKHHRELMLHFESIRIYEDMGENTVCTVVKLAAITVYSYTTHHMTSSARLLLRTYVNETWQLLLIITNRQLKLAHFRLIYDCKSAQSRYNYSNFYSATQTANIMITRRYETNCTTEPDTSIQNSTDLASLSRVPCCYNKTN